MDTRSGTHVLRYTLACSHMLTHIHTLTHTIKTLTPTRPHTTFTYSHNLTLVCTHLISRSESCMPSHVSLTHVPHTATHMLTHQQHSPCSFSLWLQGPPLAPAEAPEGRWETSTHCDTVPGGPPQLSPSAHLGVQVSDQQSLLPPTPLPSTLWDRKWAPAL